jgi:hypothetical protein
MPVPTARWIQVKTVSVLFSMLTEANYSSIIGRTLLTNNLSLYILRRKKNYNTQFNSFKPEIRLRSIQKFSSYLTGNTLRLRYKAQPVNAV